MCCSITLYLLVVVYVLDEWDKGPTVLVLHKPFDLSSVFMVDDLHCVFQGITKQMLHFWFSKKHSKKDYSIRKKIS